MHDTVAGSINVHFFDGCAASGQATATESASAGTQIIALAIASLAIGTCWKRIGNARPYFNGAIGMPSLCLDPADDKYCSEVSLMLVSKVIAQAILFQSCSRCMPPGKNALAAADRASEAGGSSSLH